MAVQFVIGRAGTGKTRHCLEQARQEATRSGLSARVFLILPPQGTFMAERELVCRHSQASLPGVQVVSFDSLVRELAGHDARLAVTAQGRRLVFSHLLRQHAAELKHFSKSAHQAHLPARLDAVLRELEVGNVSFEEMEAALAATDQLASVAGKLHDLRLLQSAWETFLGHERIDPARRLKEAAARIQRHPALQGAVIFVDGFVTFSAAQRQILLALARSASRLEICLLMDTQAAVLNSPGALPAPGLFHRCEAAYLKLRECFLKEGVPLAPPLLLRQQHRAAAAPPLASLEQHWYAAAPPPATTAAVQLLEAPSPRQEIQLAAGIIRQWQNEGIRYREIGVFARSLEDYHPWVHALFREHGIPCFVDRRRPMAHHALLRFVSAVLDLLRRGWRQETVIDLLKTGLLPLTDTEAQRLENFALLHGIGNTGRSAIWTQEEPWQFTAHPGQEPEDSDWQQQQEAAENDFCDQLRRRALFPIRDFTRRAAAESQTVAALTRSLYDLLACPQLSIRGRLAAWITNSDHDLAAEHQQAWANLTKLLEELTRLLGDQALKAADFASTLEAAIEGFDLAITPPTLDQVLVGQIDRSRSPEFKRVILLGLSDGQFPARPTEDPIFSDAERQAMLARGIEVSEDSLRLIQNERLLGYLAVTRASEALVLSRHTHGDGGEQLPPSPFLAEVKRILTPAAAPAASDWSAEVTTPSAAAQRLATLLGSARHPGASELPLGARSLFNWLLREQPAHPAVRGLQAGLRHHNHSRLSPDLVNRLFTNELRGSVSRLEAFASCPFKHFAGYTLGLRQREVAELESVDLGNAFHSVLEQLVRQLVAGRLQWDDPQLEAMLPPLIDEVAQTLRHQLLLSSQRNKYLLTQIEKTIRQILAEQRLLRNSGSQLSPRAVEVSFGGSEPEVPPLELMTPAGRKLILQGRIDRVDVLEDQARAAVFDYKLRGKSLALDQVYHGLSLQLLTYMLVLRKYGLGQGPLTPVAGFYQQLLRSLPRAKNEAEALASREDCLDAPPRGLVYEPAARDLGGGPGSKVLKTSYRKGDSPRYDAGDLVNQQHLDALFDRAQAMLTQLADQILDGDVQIQPYMLGRATPCSMCDYRSLCRFEPSVSGYRMLPPMKRSAVLEKLLEKEAPDA